MNNELISIIVPIYNVENYLERCIKSLLSQDYENIEIILVDDGSTDNSARICQKYLEDKRVRYFYKKNGGLSDARNFGMSKMNGQYVTFVDSDDAISNDFISYNYKSLMNSGADISVCNMEFVYDDKVRNISKRDVNFVLTKDDVIEKMLYGKHYFISACGKLYHKKVFENVMFPVGQSFEDINTTYKLYLNSNKIVCSQYPRYYYFIRENSITTAKFSKKNLEQIYATDSMCDHIKNINSKFSTACLRRKIYARISTYCKMLNCNYRDKDLEDKIIEYIKCNKNSVMKDKKVSLEDKMSIILIVYFRVIFDSAWKFRNKIRRK